MVSRTVLWVASAVCVVAGAAQADDVALADSLFADGRARMKAGDHAGAIPKLLESHRLLPRGGTVLNLAICYHKVGRTASAYARYREALAYATKDKNDERKAMAEEALAELEPNLSRLTVIVTTDVAGLGVTLDDAPIGRAAWGTAFPVDPGPHTLTATAPGKVPFRATLEVGAIADAKTVTVPTLEDVPPSAPPPPTADRAPSLARTVGFVSLGLSAATLGVGGFFGLRALSLRRDSDDHCPASGCDAEGAAKSRDAVRAANVSTVLFVGGGVLAVVGGVLVLTAPARGSAPAAGTTVSLGLGQIVLTTRF